MKTKRSVIGSAVALVAVAALSARAPAGTRSPVFAPAIRLAGATGTEPRVAVEQSDTRWVVTNDARGTAIVFASTDRGASWRQTNTNPSGQTFATIDVDIVTTHTKRVIATELDGAGINLVVSFTDDGGRTWTTSKGPTLVDQDRQWLAVGPDDPSTHQPRVYLMFHNLAGGAASHNMFVATSTDAGATFGPPVPITLPPSQAYLDLQCADSGGPDGMTVNRATGVIYAYWGTRSSPAGGCGASVTGPLEFNIVAATRLWVASSPTGGLGTWTTHLAVDDNATGQIVGMQGSSGALDKAGNFYLAYPESPRAYPDFSSAPLRYRWAPPDLASWSAPRTIVRGGSAGNVLAHVQAGDPGKIDVAYFAGVSRPGADPVWFVNVAQTLDAFAASPHVTITPLSRVPAYTGTAAALMGACGSGPASGVQNGLLCDRASDVWGVALDARCYLTVAWPAVANDARGSAPGTYVSTQTGGASLCAAPVSKGKR